MIFKVSPDLLWDSNVYTLDNIPSMYGQPNK